MKYKLRQVRSFAIDNAKEDNTFISMSLSSETPVLRSFGNEILLHNVDNIDMSRTMPNGLPLLINHDDTTLPVGRLKNIRLDSDTKKLRGDAYFSGRADAQSVRQDILDGIISDVSIGYRILDYKVRKAELEDTPNDFLVTKWQPYEGSLVGLPADNSVGVGRADTEDEEAEVNEAQLEEAIETELTEGVAAVEALEQVQATEEATEEAEQPVAETSEDEIPAGETPVEATPLEVNEELDEEDNKRSLEINDKTELLNTELLALRNIAVAQKLKTEVEIDLILSRTTDITEARKELLNTKEQSIILIKENRNMLTNEMLYRGLANAIKGDFKNLDESLAGVINQKGERAFTADLFTRADNWSGDTVASNMTTGQYGANAVYQQNIGFLDLLRARAVCLSAGAKTRSGSGSLSYLRQSVATTVVNKAEDSGVPTNSYVDFVKVPYTPHALVSTVYLTDELQKESIVDLQEVLRGDMVKQFALAIDNMAINGVTGAYTVNGLLSAASSIQNGNLGASAVPTFTSVNNLKALVDQYAVDLDKSAFITTPGLMGVLETTAKFSGGAGFPIADAGKINGYKAFTSTNVPIASSLYHTLIFGDFSNLEIALMGPTEFMVDIQTRFSEGITILTARQYVDIGVLQPNAFAKCGNFKLS